MARVFDMTAEQSVRPCYARGVRDPSGDPFAVPEGWGFRVDRAGAAVSLPGDKPLPWYQWVGSAMEPCAAPAARALALTTFRAVFREGGAWRGLLVYVESGTVKTALVTGSAVYKCDAYQVRDGAGNITPVARDLELQEQGQHWSLLPVAYNWTALKVNADITFLAVLNGYDSPVAVWPMLNDQFDIIDYGRPIAAWAPWPMQAGLNDFVNYQRRLVEPALIVRNNNRWVVAQGRYLHFSDGFTPYIWPFTNVFDMRADVGDRVTGLVNVNDEQLVVLTERWVGVMTTPQGDTVGLTDRVEVLSPAAGCVAPASVVATERGVYWRGRHRFYGLFNGAVTPLDEAEQFLAGEIGGGGLEFCRGQYDAARGWVRWVTPSRSSRDNLASAIYDERNERWYFQRDTAYEVLACPPPGADFPVLAAGAGLAADDTRLQVVCEGAAWERRAGLTAASGGADLSRPLDFHLRTGAGDLGDASRKQALSLDLVLDLAADHDVYAGLCADGDPEAFVWREPETRRRRRLHYVRALIVATVGGVPQLVETEPADLPLGAMNSAGTPVQIYFVCDCAFRGLNLIVATANATGIAVSKRHWQVYDDVTAAWVDLEIESDGTYNTVPATAVPFAGSGLVLWRWPSRWPKLTSAGGYTLPSPGYVVRLNFDSGYSPATGTAFAADDTTNAVRALQPFDCRRVIAGPRAGGDIAVAGRSTGNAAAALYGSGPAAYSLPTAGETHFEGHTFAAVIDARVRGGPLVVREHFVRVGAAAERLAA